MMKKLTKDQRNRLHKVATDLMAIWEELPIAEDEEGMDWGYRGGLMQLTCKGGYTQGWVDLGWSDVIADIYAGEKLACIKKYTYEELVKDATRESVEIDQRTKARRKGMTAEEWEADVEKYGVTGWKYDETGS